MSFLAPGHYAPWPSFQNQWLAASGMALLAVAVGLASSTCGRKVAWPGPAGLALLSATVPWLQWVGGQVLFVSDALLPSLYFVALACAVVAGAALERWSGSVWIDRLFLALGGAAAVSAGLALAQWSGQAWAGLWISEVPPDTRPYANLGQANHLATLLLLGVVACFRAFERRQLGASACIALLVWLVVGLMLVQSRTALLGALLLGGLSLIYGRRAGLRTPRWVVIVGLVLFLLVVAGWHVLSQEMLLTSAESAAERVAIGPRREIWASALTAISRAPWLGYGWNQIGMAEHLTALDVAPVHRMYESAHNVILDFALSAGLPFAVIWLLAGVVWLAIQLRRCVDIDALSLLMALGVIMVHGCLEFPFDYTYFLVPFGLFVGMLGARHPAPAARYRSLSPVTLLLPAVVGSLLLFWIGREYLQMEGADRQLRFAMSYGRAGVDPLPQAPVPDVVLLDELREQHRFKGTRAHAHMTAEELEWMRAAALRYPIPPALLRYALAAGLNGQPDVAVMTLQRLCAAHLQARCDEARQSWRALQATYPGLPDMATP